MQLCVRNHDILNSHSISIKILIVYFNVVQICESMKFERTIFFRFLLNCSLIDTYGLMSLCLL
jgi:hypothetical protein